MFIRLLATQIGQFWELIKYAVNRVEGVDTSDSTKIYNQLLAELLSDKAQCIIGYDDNSNVKGLIVTKILYDSLSGAKNLYIRCLYMFSSGDSTYWKAGLEYVKDMAITEQCNKITFESSNQKLISIVKSLGAREISTNLYIEV